MILVAGMGGQLTEISVERFPNRLVIMPTHSGIDTDIRHMLVKIYLKNPKYIGVDGVSSLQITSLWQQSYSLILKNSPFIQFKGSAIFPMLYLENSGNFSPDGQIYLAQIIQKGSSNISVRHASGRAVNIQNSGSGNISLCGNNIGVTNIVNEGSGSVSIQQASGGAINLNNHGVGSIKLVGHNMGLRNVIQEGPGSIVVYNTGMPPVLGPLMIFTEHGGPLVLEGIHNSNVNLNILSIGVVRLSGTADKLTTEIHESSVLISPRYVVRDAYIRTHDAAIVRLTVSNRIFANSFDQSRIEYYGLPPYRFEQARAASAILALTNTPGTYTAKFD